ncbi:MAG: hypothetical protein J7518_22560 [Nocardioidaceae bacterium]|nr:hypothetical protein [Nocardioidaceae bacterium]
MTERGKAFSYVGFSLTADGSLTCDYDLDGDLFTERFELGGIETGEGAWTSPAAQAVARLVFLLAGVSYYKTGAPPRIEVPGGLTATERSFLRDYYLHGLAEFAHTGGHDLTDLEIDAPPRPAEPVAADVTPGRPLVPFGGGIDSVVVVEDVKAALPDAALFVANTSDVPFQPIEDTAVVTGLPVLRARRHLDPKVLESKARGYFNGHVPVTGIISALALLVAAGTGRDRVVMSNEHSASEPTGMVANGVPVNHQWSKSLAFEEGFRAVLAESVAGLGYYSALRPYSELWVARRFADLPGYHLAFRSCNKAFFVDPESRLPSWCGECDKCCFIDLILAPYLAPERLGEIFRGREPLERADLEPEFRSLLGEPGRSKPLECVGDEGECRRAALLAAARPDRSGNAVLAALSSYVGSSGMDTPSEDTLLHRQGPHFLPADA